jgi:hypothetical protein
MGSDAQTVQTTQNRLPTTGVGNRGSNPRRPVMKVSLLGPTNMTKFSALLGKPLHEIEALGTEVGQATARSHCSLVVVFNCSGMLRIVGESHKQSGGKLEMLYTDNDYDWETACYKGDLTFADVTIEKESWHDMLLSLVKDSDVVICAGLSAGVFAELAYMKWNYQEKKGKVKGAHRHQGAASRRRVPT